MLWNGASYACKVKVEYVKMDLSRLGVCYPKHMAEAAFYLAERPSGLGRWADAATLPNA